MNNQNVVFCFFRPSKSLLHNPQKISVWSGRRPEDGRSSSSVTLVSTYRVTQWRNSGHSMLPDYWSVSTLQLCSACKTERHDKPALNSSIVFRAVICCLPSPAQSFLVSRPITLLLFVPRPLIYFEIEPPPRREDWSDCYRRLSCPVLSCFPLISYYIDRWGHSVTWSLIPSRMWRSVVRYEFTNITKNLLTPSSGRKISHAMNDQEESIEQSNTRTCHVVLCWPVCRETTCLMLVAWLAFRHCRWRQYVLLDRRWTSTELHDSTSSKIVAPVRTLSPTYIILYCSILLYFANGFTVSRWVRLSIKLAKSYSLHVPTYMVTIGCFKITVIEISSF
jgi:hypothetical protein